MSVDPGESLHVLAAELGTPVGIAHAHVRLLLEVRLSNEGDRRRALEQLQKALARLSDLSHETSALANWLDREDSPVVRIDAARLVESVMSPPSNSRVVLDTSDLPAMAALTSADCPQ